MKYHQISPPDQLKEWVRYFWVLESDGVKYVDQVLSPLADGCPGILFQHSSEGVFVDPLKEKLPEILLYGQTVRCSDLYLKGNFKTVGVCFYPSTLSSLFEFDASDLTNSCMDLTLLLGHLKEPLLNSQSPTDQIGIFSSHLQTLLMKRGATIDKVTQHAVSRISESNGNVSLKTLQNELQLSERGLQRKFDRHVGISPKLFSRVCRFQASLGQLKNNNFDNLSDIAFDNGYADQSHFIRTFKEFAGFSPLQFQKSKRKLTSNFSVE